MERNSRGLRAPFDAVALTGALALLAGCAGSHESQVDSDYTRLREQRGAEGSGGGADLLDGTLQGYVSYAILNSPELEASWSRYRASVLQIAPRRKLPEPMISYGYFVRSMDERHRVMIRQDFPWPTRLTSGADAQAQMARAQARRFEAGALAIAQRVAAAYWQLWLIHRSHMLMRDQEDVYVTLEGSIEARVAVGNADLADLGQVQLRLERMRDHRSQHREAARMTSARLAALIGAPPGTATPVTEDPPEVALPAADRDALLAEALAHPRVDALGYMAEASEERADAEQAAGLPMFSLGVEWMEMRQTAADPIMVSIGVTLPIWFGTYDDAADAARAEASAYRADRESAEQQAAAELIEALTKIRDSHRRVLLYQDTLAPQADSVFGSSLGSYQSGRAGLAIVLLAVRELLEIQLERERALADHATAWAQLEHIVGRPVERREATFEEVSR